MLTRFGGAAARSAVRSTRCLERRDAAGEGRLLQAFGGLAFSLMRDASPEVSGRVAERLNGPAMRGLSGVSSGSGMPNAVSRKMPDSVTRWPSTPSSPACAPRSAAGRTPRRPLPGNCPSSRRPTEAVCTPPCRALRTPSTPRSPPVRPSLPAQAGKLAATPAQHRDFLLSMLPIYHDHERPGAFDHGAAYHGRGHICRAFIFASTMAGLMEEMGHTVDRTALLCGIARHDAGRERNGADTPEQEAESARLAP